MYNPYICIASFIEAVVFKSICPKLYILKSTYKNKKILGKKTSTNKIWKFSCIGVDKLYAKWYISIISELFNV